MKNNSFKYQIFLKLSYYDFKIIDQVVVNIISILNSFFTKNELKISKITFPLRNTLITVLKSPHVAKKSREQFNHSIHSYGLSFKIYNKDIFMFIYYFINNVVKKTSCKYNLKTKVLYE